MLNAGYYLPSIILVLVDMLLVSRQQVLGTSVVTETASGRTSPNYPPKVHRYREGQKLGRTCQTSLDLGLDRIGRVEFLARAVEYSGSGWAMLCSTQVLLVCKLAVTKKLVVTSNVTLQNKNWTYHFQNSRLVELKRH